MIFSISGHENVLATHRNTLEFTKDDHLTKDGDCILGINADFDYDGLMNIVKNSSRIKIVIKAGGLQDEIACDVNKGFNDRHEMVIRKTDFISDRTLGINADKAAIDIDKRLVEKLKSDEKVEVEIIELN